MKRLSSLCLSLLLLLIIGFSSCDSTSLMWFHPASYSDAINPAGTTAIFPDLAMNSKGDSIVVWTQSDGTNNLIYKREYRDGEWSEMPNLLTDAFCKSGQSVAYSKVAMDDSGDALVAWTQSDGVRSLLYIREYRDGVWSSIPELDTGEFSPDGQNVTGFPAVAMSDNGDAVVAWIQNNGSNDLIYVRDYRNGVWSSKPDLLTGSFSEIGQSSTQVEVAMDDDGNTIVVWQQSNGTNSMIYMREYRDGSWSSKPALLTGNFSPTGQNAGIPKVAMDNDGNAIVTYLQNNTSAEAMVYKREYRDGSWSSIPSLDTGNISPAGENAAFTAVAMSDKGNAIITWVQSDGASLLIFKSEYKDGVWTHPADLSDTFGPLIGDVIYWPEVKMNSKGDAIIAYQMISGSAMSLLLSEYSGGVWTHPESVRDSITPNEGIVQNLMPGFATPLAMNDRGKAIIAWTGFDNLTLPSIFVSLKK